MIVAADLQDIKGVLEYEYEFKIGEEIIYSWVGSAKKQ